MSKLLPYLVSATGWWGLLGCASYDAPFEPTATVLSFVAPAGGADGVDVDAEITIRFSGPVAPGSARQLVLHRDHASGPVVPGAALLSEDARGIRFAPVERLRAQTKYALHIGGGIVDVSGKRVDLRAGKSMGGEWVSWVMATGGRGARHGDQSMATRRWQAANGTFGMLVTFTTR